MAKRILKEEQLIDVIWGATLMGGGGGGAMVGGTDLLDTYKKLHPEKPVELTLLETCDMDPEAYGAVTAGSVERVGQAGDLIQNALYPLREGGSVHCVPPS